MELRLGLCWHRGGRSIASAFKQRPAFSLVEDYAGRLKRSGGLVIQGVQLDRFQRAPAEKLWLCDRGPGTRTLSSEEIAEQLRRLRDGGTRVLHVLIGGPDGFDEATRQRLRPELRWCFGPLTLPHELAAVVAAEQLYRGVSILQGSPYHLGH